MRKVSLLLILIACFMLSACGDLYIKTTDVSKYEDYFGTDVPQRNNTMISLEILPESLPASAEVEKFGYESIDIMDPNYTSILVYSCDDADYADEIRRLSEIGIEDYSNQPYGIKSFPYELVALKVNEYGAVYAMTDEESNTMIYGEIVFCNYFSDSNYKKMIGAEYLPEGFDATKGNATRKAFEAGENMFSKIG